MLILAMLFMVNGTACTRHVSDRELFNRAVVAGKSANANARWYIFSEIAKAEAKHGYYDDALQALKLTDKFPDQLIVDIVSIRARNGDISSAKTMAESTASQEEKWKCLERIADVQAESGDVIGARETLRSLPTRFQQDVLETIGTHQAQSGDVESALKTAREMERGWSDGVLFEVADKFAARGDKAQAHQIALRITDPVMARNVGIAHSPLPPPSNPCDLAAQEADSGKYNDAVKRLDGSKCDCRTVAYIHERGGNPAAAEHSMRSCPNPADVSAGMAELAKESAAKGDIGAALRFADGVHVTGADFEEGYLAPALRDIGRSWASKDRKAALKWAESKPDGYQRAMALLGVAEGMETKPKDVPPPPARHP
jgi:hypothetical protein